MAPSLHGQDVLVVGAGKSGLSAARLLARTGAHVSVEEVRPLATVLGLLLRALFGGAPIYALVMGGASLVLAGALMLRVPQPASAARG